MDCIKYKLHVYEHIKVIVKEQIIKNITQSSQSLVNKRTLSV